MFDVLLRNTKGSGLKVVELPITNTNVENLHQADFSSTGIGILLVLYGMTTRDCMCSADLSRIHPTSHAHTVSNFIIPNAPTTINSVKKKLMKNYRTKPPQKERIL